MDRALRLITSGAKAGLRPLTVDMLAAILQERERVGEATARAVADEALASPHGDAPPRPDLAAAQHRRPVL